MLKRSSWFALGTGYLGAGLGPTVDKQPVCMEFVWNLRFSQKWIFSNI